MNINQMSPQTGRYLKEDNTAVNLAERMEAIYNALITNKDAGVQLTGTNIQVYDGTATWANSAAVGTIVDIDFPLPTPLQGNALYEVVVTNPSGVTDLTVRVKNKETFGGTARYPELTSFPVAANSPDGKAVLVQGWLLGEGGRLSLSNDTALGASDGFTANVRIRKV